MKLYYPTTTLNFDSILSSQMISPACLYKPGTLWWNRHESMTGEQAESLVLYNKCPIWDVDDLERDNYPMVMEFDKNFTKMDKVICPVNKSLKATCIFESITFSALDVMQGKVRFLFRNKSEMERMLVRADTSVGECKVVNAVKIDCPWMFDVMPTSKSKTFKIEIALDAVSEALKMRVENRTLVYSNFEIRTERTQGAKLGYQVGRYAKFIRTGLYLDGYRDAVSYEDWRTKVLPEPFSTIIAKLYNRPLVQWDPNREAIAEFCRQCWNDCFHGKKFKGETIVEGTRIHVSLQSLARYWLSPDDTYNISTEENPYMQAFAAFLECGNNASKYPRFIKEPFLKLPEYLLALYGALVGYTFFSRILLENNVYQSVEVKDVDVNEKKKSSLVKIKVPKKVLTDSNGDEIVQPSLFGSILVSDRSLLVCDSDLTEDIAQEFASFGHERVGHLQTIVKLFSKRYIDGYYGRNPEKYGQNNPDLISHLMSCMSSTSTKDLNFSMRDEERRQFEAFLKKRYNCG